MIIPAKDKAVESLLGADSFVCITARSLPQDHAEVSVFHSGKQELTATIAREMLVLVRLLLFEGDEEEEG